VLLLTVNQWLGPSRVATQRLGDMAFKPRTELQGIATRLPLAEAIASLKEYEVVYRERFGSSLAVEFSLISVSVIDDLTDEELDKARVSLAEGLAKNLRKSG